jgi:hypothetical protein
VSEPIHEEAETARCHTDTRVRVGILWAARIAPIALVKPAADESEAEVTAIAARDLERARRFAAKHKISTAYGVRRTARTLNSSQTQTSTLST